MELACRPRSRRSRAAPLLAIAALGLFPIRASAQPGDKRATEDEAARLFAEGREALAHKDGVTACSRFRSSLELAARPNTLFNVAQCDEQSGKIAAALSRWQQGVAMLAESDERLTIARQRVRALDAKVPRLTIALPADAPSEARVTADGAPLNRAVLGTPIPMEIGSHSIAVEAPGRRPARVDVQLAEGDRKEILISPGPTSEPRDVAKNNTKKKDPPSSTNGLRTAGIVVGAVGLAGAVAAGVTGGLILAKDARIQDDCPKQACNAAGWEEVSTTGSLFTVNTVAFITGIAGVGAGAVLLLVSRSGGDAPPNPSASVAPTVLPGGGGVAITGRF